MKHIIYRILLLFCLAMMAAFTLVPPAHQIPDNNRFVAEVVYQRPPVATLTIATPDAEVVKGEQVCIAVTANDFDQILTMQYSMTWDPAILSFKYFKSFGLKGMDARNFGQHLLEKGVLTFSWYDQNLVGVTHDDGVVLYELCFDAIGRQGSETSLEFSSTPTVVEISNAASHFLDLRTDTGKIQIK